MSHRVQWGQNPNGVSGSLNKVILGNQKKPNDSSPPNNSEDEIKDLEADQPILEDTNIQENIRPLDDISEHDVRIEETIEMSPPASRLNTHNDLIKEEIVDKHHEMMGS